MADDGPRERPNQSEPHRYKLTYRVEAQGPEGIFREQIPCGNGACDALILVSILYPQDGSFSLAMSSRDGRTNEPVDDGELFKAWAMLAKRLAESKTLGPNKRQLCKTTFEIFREAILQASGKGGKQPERD